MNRAGQGLTKVHTDHLVTLLRMVSRGELTAPVDVIGLARVGLQHCAEPLLDAIRGLDDRALRTLLVCIIAERRAR